MKNNSESRSQIRQILALLVFSIYLSHRATVSAAVQKHNAEILIKGYSDSNSSHSLVPKIVKLAHYGHPEVSGAPENIGESTFTLKSDQLRVQSDFKTVDINVLNRQRDQENAKKIAMVQEDLQSRIKINEPESVSKDPIERETEREPDPEEVLTKQARVKEDIESRVLQDDELLGYRVGVERKEKLHYPVKRSDDDYYEADEPEVPQQARMTTEAPKEEDSFFSIFESLFGSSDDESQTKKKSNPEDETMFKDPGEESLKENIKTVGSLLKPLKPIDKPEAETQTSFSVHQTNVPEYRIVNNYHSSQYHKQPYKQSELKPSYHSSYRPTEQPFRPHKPHTTNGYEDYDLEEFMDKAPSTAKVKYVSPIMTAASTTKHPTTITIIPTTTTVRTTTKNTYDNKLRFPSIQKKNDYINRNRYQEVKQEPTEKITERVTYNDSENRTTTEIHYYSKPSHESKDAEKKNQKIHESPNFYNLINLPVRYSTKDTAIPLISTSYANTKIQGMGAYKYEKGGNGKYPNHKYDQVSSSTTMKGPTYWATRRTSTERTSTERTTTSFRPSLMISKATTKYVPGSDLDKVEYDDVPMGMGPALGNYGSKTGVEIKTQTPERQTSTVGFYKETTTRRDDVQPTTQATVDGFHSKQDGMRYQEKVPEKTSVKPVKEIYEDYEYDNFPDQESVVKNSNQNYPPNVVNKDRISESEYKTQQYTNSYKTTWSSTAAPKKEPNAPPEAVEYEYYDYDIDPAATTVTTTTTKRTTTSTKTPASKYKIKYPNLSKDKIKTFSSEKVAVVVPSKDSEYYKEDQSKPEPVRTSTVIISSTNGVTPTTSSKPPQTTTVGHSKIPENEITGQVQKTTPQFPTSKPTYKEPAPVFEDVKEEYTTKQMSTLTTKKVSENFITTEATVRPVIMTSSSKDPETNANVVLVPTKETVKNTDAVEKFSRPEPPAAGTVQKTQQKLTESLQPGFDYTTEFTVGFIHGGHGHQGPSKNPTGQGHFVASSISTNPYGDDEPFRPIPKPPGLPPSYQVAHEEVRRPPIKNPPVFHNQRPVLPPPSLEESEPIHEPHEFIPSPQFHRPVDPKPSIPVRQSADLDYDFEGIQTEPKPGQYVIFSKPQLKPEVNESQLKKKPEISSPSKVVTNVPHYHEKVNPYWQDSQKHLVFNPKEGQIYQSGGKPKLPSDKSEANRPTHGAQPDGDSLPLQLVPPKENQPEKPFEGNFVLPEENQESTVSYPRPHWEKNGKPSFLMNTMSNKNDMVGGRPPHLPPQMAPTLIPPSSIPPQRFRRPLHPHMPPMRKNFNEAGTNVKPKPNLPNILPQFRPNTKVGSGPYHRPPGYPTSNRRNGVNRYHESEHGNFPYHIQHPDKDAPVYREFEMEQEIIPKFITNRGKLPSDGRNSQGMQKRFGQGPQNVATEENRRFPQQNQRILKRHQRTPVTTLQMLKQMSGVKTQKTHISREDSADSSVPLFPPIYKTYKDQPKNNEKVYIVYPARAPQKLHSDDTKVFIVSDTKSKKNYYNFTKAEEQQPLINPARKDSSNSKSKNNFPYGFVKPVDRAAAKQNEENIKQTAKTDDSEKGKSPQETKVLPAAVREKDEKIDMLLHMQSNNQWNEVRTPPDSMLSVRNPSEASGSEHYRFSDYGERKNQPDNSQIQLNPPSEYHTSIKHDSAFTLGAVMHTMSEGSKREQIASIPLRSETQELDAPKLNVNERISNGKIVTVSMPLDVKQDSAEKEGQSKYQFQAPFQPSSSLTSNGSHPVSQGWSIVKNPDDTSEAEEGSKSTETSTNSSFNFENFKPELIGGFKPLFEIPEKPEEEEKQPKPSGAVERTR